MTSKQEKLVISEALGTTFPDRFGLLSNSFTDAAVATFRGASGEHPDSLRFFWEQTRFLGSAAMRNLLGHHPDMTSGNTLAVAIPRAAYPFMEGGLQEAQLPVLYTNDGGFKDSSKPLIPDDLPSMRLDYLLIWDPVIDTGATYERTVRALNERGVIADNIIAVAVITHPPTAEVLLGRHPNLSIVTFDLEPETIPAPTGNGRWLAGFGDIGGVVAAAITTCPELSTGLVQPGFYH